MGRFHRYVKLGDSVMHFHNYLEETFKKQLLTEEKRDNCITLESALKPVY